MTNMKSNHAGECNSEHDEEENMKLQEIIDLLVAAGYFRARIKGLSAFDKVVGGMIWSMDSCNFDVNVDLLFQENSTIGQKIALTEKITTVLPKMECPHRIEPHQIQGLDFSHIFPVIQWLVKRSVKIREEKRVFIRRHTVLKFHKQFSCREPSSQLQLCSENIKKVQVIVKNIARAEEKYRKRRMFKQRNSFLKTTEAQVDSTLLEYGFPYNPLESETDSLKHNTFSVAKEQLNAVPLKTIGSVVTLQAEQIALVSHQFAKLKMHIESSGASLMIKQKHMILEKRSALLKEEEQLEKEIDAESQKLLQSNKKLRELAEISGEGKEINQRIYEKLQSLILLEENLRRQELSFREHCKLKLEKLQSIIKHETFGRNEEPEHSLADNQLQAEKEKVQELRLQIAKKNRAIAFLQRQLDEVPGRGELAQYQRRFLELYNEVAQKYEEIKQFYSMYNTLDDTKLYLSKELSLLNSVLDNYSEAMSNAIDKEEFMTQFESIVSAIKQNKKKVEKRKANERSRRDKLSKQLLDLVEQQRSYVNIVKQLKIECKKNEELLARFRKQV